MLNNFIAHPALEREFALPVDKQQQLFHRHVCIHVAKRVAEQKAEARMRVGADT